MITSGGVETRVAQTTEMAAETELYRNTRSHNGPEDDEVSPIPSIHSGRMTTGMEENERVESRPG